MTGEIIHQHGGRREGIKLPNKLGVVATSGLPPLTRVAGVITAAARGLPTGVVTGRTGSNRGPGLVDIQKPLIAQPCLRVGRRHAFSVSIVTA